MNGCAKEMEWGLYIDGEMSGEKLREMESHLVGCPRCERLVARLRRETATIAGALAADPVPPDLVPFIQGRMAGALYNRGGGMLLFLTVICLSGLAAALFSGWIPLLERIGWLLELMAGGDLVLQVIFFGAGLAALLGEGAMRGGPLMPALAVMILCMVWLQIKLTIGGRSHV